MAGRDIGAALFLLAGAALLVGVVIPAETIPGDEGELAQAFMPTLAAAAIAIAAGLILVRAVSERVRARRGTHSGPEVPEVPDPASVEPERQPIDRFFWSVLAGATLLFGLVLAALGGYGFLVGGGASILAFGLVFGRRRWPSVLALAVLFPAAAYFLVLHGLGLALP